MFKTLFSKIISGIVSALLLAGIIYYCVTKFLLRQTNWLVTAVDAVFLFITKNWLIILICFAIIAIMWLIFVVVSKVKGNK